MNIITFSFINLFVKDRAMRDYKIIKTAIFILSIVAISACVQQQAITEIYVPGHGNQIYAFSYDIRESVKVAADNETAIRNLLANSNRLTILFNGTSDEDNAVFQVLVFNIAAKLPTYYSYEGRLVAIDALYYSDDGLYNKSKERVSLPETTKILLLGPNTGAKKTAVNLNGNTITVQGMTKKDVVLAGDKLALIAMNITEEKIQQTLKATG